MRDKHKSIFRLFFNAVSAAVTAAVSAMYPVLFFLFLIILNVPIRMFSLFIIVFALFEFFFRFSKRKTDKKKGFSFINSILFLVIGVLCFIINNNIILKFYPMLINIVLLFTFGITLFQPPVMIYRFAVLADKSIPNSLGEKKIAAYCRKVTVLWVVYFIINGTISALTVFFVSDFIWVIYNGPVSGFLIGTIFTAEFIVRKIVQRKIPKAVPVSSFNKKSRNLSDVMCYEGSWNDGSYKTWGDFLKCTAVLRRRINEVKSKRWILHCDDYWLFLLAFVSLLQCKKEIILTANISPEYIAEILSNGSEEIVPFLSDQTFPEGQQPSNYIYIPSAFSAYPAALREELRDFPSINADETSIILYTSGSTGKPKAVQQRLTEFEEDNRFILSKWGDEFICRKLCSTVSQYHIYGLLFSILLPFTAGVPFRRCRIQTPQEFEKLTDTKYMIITVPAFLKRAVELESTDTLNLKSPWIFTSGGALAKDTAEKTSRLFGFWPVEVYGSTETSGIAWRQSLNGFEWTPFDNAQLSSNNEGCLVVRSPYIKDPAGFETADLVEILADGRFLLKGRFDSVVKIEEKRVSLAEIEARILQSGLAGDAYVLPMEGKRQYLAAVIVFNDKGKEMFNNFNKNDINKFWRNYLQKYFENVVIPKRWRYPQALPVDIQGKKKIEEIRLLFA